MNLMGEGLTQRPGGAKRHAFLGLLIVAFVLSLSLHAFLWMRTRSIRMNGFSPETYDTIVPRTFRMKRVEIDPKALEVKDPSPPPKKAEVIAPSGERPTAPELSGKAAELAVPAPLPQSASSPSQGAVSADQGKGPDFPEMPNPTLPPPINGSSTESADAPSGLGKGIAALDLPDPSGSEPTGQGKGTNVSFSSLDDLLAGRTPVTPETPPILMPTDLLFEYDSDVLRPEAARSLEKLGALIRRNSGSLFRIEGHTDSFGTREYNQALSLRRAVAVKEWLEKSMGVDPSAVLAVGLGTTHPLAPVTGTIAEQRLNRRVEIVISAR